jgi:hypothetical protein
MEIIRIIYHSNGYLEGLWRVCGMKKYIRHAHGDRREAVNALLAVHACYRSHVSVHDLVAYVCERAYPYKDIVCDFASV